MYNKFFLILIFISLSISIKASNDNEELEEDQSNNKKIIGLVAQRNESNFIKQFLTILSLYTDAIIVLDDCSTDNSVKIIKSIAKKCNIVEIIEKKEWYRDEAGDRNLLLSAGRKHKGTHFIILDADEVLSSNCLENNKFRNMFLKLKPGERLAMYWYQLWKSLDFFRLDGPYGPTMGIWAFCDDRKCSYDNSFLHTARVPTNLKGKIYPLSQGFGVLHFQFVNWQNLLIKQAWYRCLERIRLPEKPIEDINRMYADSKNETELTIKKIPAAWFKHYKEFDQSVYLKEENWRKKQVLSWFKEYGKEYFNDLDIWDVNWS